MEEEFISGREKECTSGTLDGGAPNRIYSQISAEDVKALESSFKLVLEIMKKLCSCNDRVVPEKKGNITSWEILFDLVTDLSLDDLCDKLLKTVFIAVGSF